MHRELTLLLRLLHPLAYFKDIYQKVIPGISKIDLAKSENLIMELYESRIASLQRFVSMCVLFHRMSSRVQSFFATISFGLWSYRIDRTHSIMRVATTASPASGAHVRKQMEVLAVLNNLNRAVHTIAAAWFHYKQRKVQALLAKNNGVGTTAAAAANTAANANTNTANSSSFLPHPTPGDKDTLTDDDGSFDKNDE